jgi:hypothetical protein
LVLGNGAVAERLKKSKEPALRSSGQAGRPSFVRVNPFVPQGKPALRKALVCRISGRGGGVAPTALGSVREYSQRLRAGLTSAAPTALRKREVKRAGPSFLRASGRPFLRQGKPALRKATAEPRCRAEGRGATFKPSSDEQRQKSPWDAGATKGDGRTKMPR